jgi:hypothetical protein
MLFIGAIPRPVVEQALKVVDLSGVEDVFVCCSGSFRLEQALAARFKDVRVHSNDVSLLSTALGRYATGNPLAWQFHGRLEFLERFGRHDPLERLAALAVAVRCGHFAGKNAFARSHFAHYEANADDYVAGQKAKLSSYLARLRLASFTARDFREHARAAVAAGAWVFAWPPTYKGGYEQLFRLIRENTSWEEPTYDVFDPKSLPGWLDELEQVEARFVVCADHELEGHRAAAMYAPGRARRIWLYTSSGRSASLRREQAKREPFRYEPVDATSLGPTADVRLVQVTGPRMNFLKDHYLAPGLEHSDGDMRFVVFVSGKVRGRLHLPKRRAPGRRDLPDLRLLGFARPTPLEARRHAGDRRGAGQRVAAAEARAHPRIFHDRLHRQAGVDEVPRHLRTRRSKARLSQLPERGATCLKPSNLYRLVATIRRKRPISVRRPPCSSSPVSDPVSSSLESSEATSGHSGSSRRTHAT